MAEVGIPSLTTDGTLINKTEQMKKLFQYFLASDYSQSNVFYGKIASLKAILAMYSEPADIKRNIELVLTKQYQNYYDIVAVNVTIVYNDNKTEYLIEIKTEHAGKTYELKQLLNNSLCNIETYNTALAALLETYGVV